MQAVETKIFRIPLFRNQILETMRSVRHRTGGPWLHQIKGSWRQISKYCRIDGRLSHHPRRREASGGVADLVNRNPFGASSAGYLDLLRLSRWPRRAGTRGGAGEGVSTGHEARMGRARRLGASSVPQPPRMLRGRPSQCCCTKALGHAKSQDFVESDAHSHHIPV